MFRSIRKSLKLRRLSKALSPPESIDQIVSNFMKQLSERRSTRQDIALDGLIDLCVTDPTLSKILQLHGADSNTLRELHKTLLLNGAGQWVRGHFVAASALCFGQTLLYCLTTKDTARHMAFKLVYYFDKREVGFLE